jgi:hypothetical protein
MSQGGAGEAVKPVIPRLHQTIGWATGGLGIIALATGIGYGVQALDEAGQARESEDPELTARMNRRAHQDAVRADLMLATSAVGLGTTILLWWVLPRGGEVSPKIKISPAPGGGGVFYDSNF